VLKKNMTAIEMRQLMIDKQQAYVYVFIYVLIKSLQKAVQLLFS
jgi:hypothetical protein